MDSSHKEFDFSAFEDEHGLKVAQRYKDFVNGEEIDEYNGRFVANLPNYSGDTKFKVRFLEPGFDLFGIHEIDRDDHPGWVPLSPLGREPQFLAVNVSDESCPVALWEHEDGKFHAHSESLDQFLETLLKKGQQTPAAKLSKAVKKASKLIEAEKYEQAIELLTSVENCIPRQSDITAKQNRSRYFNHRGYCFIELGKAEKAIQDYQRSLDDGSFEAGLNLVNIFIHHQYDPDKALEALKRAERLYLDPERQFRIIKFTGYIYVLKGNREKAEETYRTILERFRDTSPKHVGLCRESLEEIVNENKPNSELAKEILAWFKVPA